MTGLVQIVSAVVVIAVAACSDTTTNPRIPIATDGASSGLSGSDSGKTPAPPPPSGDQSSVSVSPHTVSLTVGGYAMLAAVERKAGVVVSTKAVWKSSNPAVATVSDTGEVFGKAAGVAAIFATIDGLTDSAEVIVSGSSSTPGTPAPAPAAASFDYLLTVAGATGAADTSLASPLAGATVSVSRFSGVKGDTLATNDPAIVKTTDSSGQVRFDALTGGGYMVTIIPPAGSPYAKWTTGFGPPTTSDFVQRVVLPRTP